MGGEKSDIRLLHNDSQDGNDDSEERNTLNQRSCNDHRRTEIAHLLWLASHSVHSLATNATDTNTCLLYTSPSPRD